MSATKPVVASNCNPIKRILDETNAGIVYESGNENDLAERVIELYEKPELQHEMGAKGKDAVIKKYNWNETSKELLNIYKLNPEITVVEKCYFSRYMKVTDCVS